MTNKYSVIIPKTVKTEIDEIISFYYVEKEDYAFKIFENFINRIDSLKEFPERGRVVPELEKNNILEYREIIESYWRIIYRIERNQVVIYTLIDGRRNVEEILIKRLRAKFA